MFQRILTITLCSFMLFSCTVNKTPDISGQSIDASGTKALETSSEVAQEEGSPFSIQVEKEKRTVLDSEIQNDFFVIYQVTNGEKIKIDESNGYIRHIENIGSLVIYESVSKSGAETIIYDSETQETLGNIPTGKISEDKNYIYACTSNGLVGSVGYYNLQTGVYKDFANLHGDTGRVQSCTYEDSAMIAEFTTDAQGIDIKKYEINFLEDSLDEIE